jgi:hypothetical protein
VKLEIIYTRTAFAALNTRLPSMASLLMELHGNILLSMQSMCILINFQAYIRLSMSSREHSDISSSRSLLLI